MSGSGLLSHRAAKRLPPVPPVPPPPPTMCGIARQSVFNALGLLRAITDTASVHAPPNTGTKKVMVGADAELVAG